VVNKRGGGKEGMRGGIKLLCRGKKRVEIKVGREKS